MSNVGSHTKFRSNALFIHLLIMQSLCDGFEDYWFNWNFYILTALFLLIWKDRRSYINVPINRIDKLLLVNEGKICNISCTI